jgi:hypothetical protein
MKYKVTQIEMNSQVKQQWITALRSNEYNQTQGSLRTSEGYCCLGVLCDLYVKEHDVEEWNVGPHGSYAFKGEPNILPNCVIEWSGLNDANPYVLSFHDDMLSLANMNDCGKTFGEIAQVIEEQL